MWFPFLAWMTTAGELEGRDQLAPKSDKGTALWIVNCWMSPVPFPSQRFRLAPTDKHCFCTKASKCWSKAHHIQERRLAPGKPGQKSNLELLCTSKTKYFDYQNFISLLKKPFAQLGSNLGCSQKLYFHINRSQCTNSEEGFLNAVIWTHCFSRGTLSQVYFLLQEL